jgi:predicted alpha/beta superfamily hydrolase
MRDIKLVSLLLTALLLSPLAAVADRSQIIAGDHEIRVALPASYGKTRQPYPVLWVTDGSMYFEIAVKAANYDLKWHVPEMIVVAVGAPAEALKDFGYRRSYEFSSSTVRGFTGFGGDLLDAQLAVAGEKRKAAGEPPLEHGGAPQFLAFLVDDVRVALARDYRMGTDHTLFGDSAGGSFCTYALFARPEAFSRYICASPNLHTGDHEMFRMEERYAKAHKDLKATVFFSAGESEILDPNEFVRAWGVVSATARMAEILSMRRYPSLKLHARILPGEDHASVPPLNLSWGLRTVWQSRESGTGKVRE